MGFRILLFLPVIKAALPTVFLILLIRFIIPTLPAFSGVDFRGELGAVSPTNVRVSLRLLTYTVGFLVIAFVYTYIIDLV